jgi:hypothetical protein
MLHRDPNQRPKDLVVLAEMIRQGLQKIERRRALADKYGIPFRTTFPPRTKAPSRPLLQIALPVAALLVAAAVLAAVLSPEPISRIIHPNRDTKKLGVLVGVPESSPSPAFQNASTPIPLAAVASQETTAAVPSSTQPPANVAAASNSPQVPPPDVQQTQTTTAQSQATAPNASEATSPAAIAESSSSPPGEANSSSKSDGGSQAAIASQSSSQSKKKSVASASRRARADQTLPDRTQRGTRSMRARVVGITSDGRFILRLPSGRTAIIAPDEQDEFAPRRHHRPYIGRDEMSAPPPQFEPDFFPDD